MTETTTMPDINQMSQAQIEALKKQIEARDKKEIQDKRRAKEAYEAKRNGLVEDLTAKAKIIQGKLARLKEESMHDLDAFYNEMLEYSDLPETNQGSFSIYNTAKTKKVSLSKQKRFKYDERASMAESHLREFLREFVKTRSKAAFDIISGLLEKKNGQYDPQLIQKLYAYENDYTHPSFKLAIKLFKESYIAVDVTTYVRYYEQDETGQIAPILLDFAKV